MLIWYDKQKRSRVRPVEINMQRKISGLEKVNKVSMEM